MEISFIDRAVGISRRIAGDGDTREIHEEIVKAAAEGAGADLVILRVAGSGDDFFEVRAYTGPEGTENIPISDCSVSRETCLRVWQNDRSLEGVKILEWDDLGDERECFVPKGIDWKGRKILIVPIADGKSVCGFFTVGFFKKAPQRHVLAVCDLYSGEVLRVVQREQNEKRLRDKERILGICREELDSVNQLKSNFLSIVSHEFRTPLTSVKAYTETLLDNVKTIKRDTLQDFLKVMDEENERLIKLVDNILDYSCMETGHLKVEKSPCNLNEMIEDIYGTLQKKFLSGRVNSDLRLPKRPVIIDADRELIRQLLQNLMSNAVKFTPEGGNVTVTLEEEASAARIVVQDTGKGIPEDQLEKIFERFHQVDTSNTREHGGSGLGLAICKNIANWHDGKIWVENIKEAGARFIVLLPMKDIIVRQAVAAGNIGSIRFERERYLTLLVEMLSEFLQACKASIMLVDKETQILRVVAAKGLDPEFVQNTRLEVGDRIAGRVAMTGESLQVFDIEKDSELGRANNTAFYDTHSFISVPLRDGGEI
ncbi:MAG: ATP-binding protein, partial [Candidatus Krumholzibacteria bacterium]|nr:ATP-binding protein [Candidatus Krumholzibacteria bacterium]